MTAGPEPALPTDGLRSAGWLAGVAAAMVIVCFITGALDGIRGAFHRSGEAIAFYSVIGLNELALVPSGQFARHPDFLAVSGDGRYLPTLPRETPGVVPLMDADRLAASRKAIP